MRKTKVQTFLDPAELSFLDRMIRQGVATNRSEAVRKCVIIATTLLEVFGVVEDG